MAHVKPSIVIDRRLEREDPTTRSSVIIDQAAILDLDDPIIILGDPGLGKSVLAREIERQAGASSMSTHQVLCGILSSLNP
ncbi:hypothetical protein NKW54_15445 [Acetobacter cerevisiae]|uniref:Uncharacterized protein n=1 Tax=Acetobacter cerevisiae TaxID=178900 RepID=A0ABT1EV93_9PROT|nr:hypothetical protein [Acetobacter cerevisiae]MCP1247305.1 hypothetical protein [Acetobacter cerevisiae]MCP1256863.1 hypothetical protein [Acetobacter cerevisiae]